MSKRWYVVHAYSGFEKSVQRALVERIARDGMQDFFGQILVPVEEVVEMRNGQKSISERKFFPGYVLANLALFDEKKNLIEETWYFIQNTPGVIGFVGGEAPVPLRADEVDRIINQVEEKKETVTPKINFEPGETIKITDGPFLNFNGVIEEVDPGRGKLKVSVSIFGRSAPVELEYWQADKA